MTTTSTPATNRVRTGRGWAYTFTVLGGLVSIAANIAHSFVPPDKAPADWAPQPGAVIGAIVWPVFLFGAVELLARVAWPDGLRWQLLRFGGMTPVAVVAALVSYRHLSALLAFYGEDTVTCLLGPLAVDGLMVMATGAILAVSHTTNDTSTTSVPSTPTPAPAAPSTPVPAVPTPTPALSTSTTAAPLPPTDEAPATPPAPAPTPVPAPSDIPSPAAVAARITPTAPAIVATRPAPPVRPDTAPTPKPRPSKADTPSVEPLAAPATDTSVTTPELAQLALPIVAPDLLKRADTVARQYRTEHGTPITAGQLAIRLKVNSEQAANALVVLNLGPDSPTSTIATVNGHTVTATR